MSFLPSSLLVLFNPRPALEHLPPCDKLPHEKKFPPYTGIAQYVTEFEDPSEAPPPTRGETVEERRARKRAERQERAKAKLEEATASWDPQANLEFKTGDPFKTLFVARINFDTTEQKLRREFEQFGPVVKCVLVEDKESGKPRGYAFIEFEHERDMRTAYKHAEGMKVDGRRILVDVERGRTVTDWKPRRLGGGLGGTREEGVRYMGRVADGEVYDKNSDRHRERERSRERERERDKERRLKEERRDERRRGPYRDMDRPDDEYRGRDRDRDRDRGRDRDRDYDRDYRGRRDDRESRDRRRY